MEGMAWTDRITGLLIGSLGPVDMGQQGALIKFDTECYLLHA